MVPFSRTSSAYLSTKSEDLLFRAFHSKNASTHSTAAGGPLIFFRESLPVDGAPVLPVVSSSSRSTPRASRAKRMWSGFAQHHGSPFGASTPSRRFESLRRAFSASAAYLADIFLATALSAGMPLRSIHIFAGRARLSISWTTSPMPRESRRSISTAARSSRTRESFRLYEIISRGRWGTDQSSP